MATVVSGNINAMRDLLASMEVVQDFLGVENSAGALPRIWRFVAPMDAPRPLIIVGLAVNGLTSRIEGVRLGPLAHAGALMVVAEQLLAGGADEAVALMAFHNFLGELIGDALVESQSPGAPALMVGTLASAGFANSDGVEEADEDDNEYLRGVVRFEWGVR